MPGLSFFTESIAKHRISRVSAELDRIRVDALIVSDPVNINYLCGFSGTYGYLLVRRNGRACLFTDSRYYERARKEAKGVDIHKVSGNWPGILLKRKIRRIGFESLNISFEIHKRWRTALKKIKLVPTIAVVEKIRSIKEPGELEIIKANVKDADSVMNHVRGWLRKGISELELRWKIEDLIESVHGRTPPFTPIVAFGKNASMPHANPGQKRLVSDSIVLVDLGTRFRAYSSDLTRTFFKGKITRQFRRVYDIVYTAQKLAIEGIRPGRKACDIDALARDYISNSGFGKHFGHSLGHGIGLTVHEFPRINPRSKDRIQPGMVFSIEPGIYIEGWGGVRIEDIVLVTNTGAEVLTSFPKHIDQVSL